MELSLRELDTLQLSKQSDLLQQLFVCSNDLGSMNLIPRTMENKQLTDVSINELIAALKRANKLCIKGSDILLFWNQHKIF